MYDSCYISFVAFVRYDGYMLSRNGEGANGLVLKKHCLGLGVGGRLTTCIAKWILTNVVRYSQYIAYC